MRVNAEVTWDTRGLAPLRPGNLQRAIGRALSKAGATALRDMRGEASKRVRARKRLKAGVVHKALRLRKPRRATIDGMEWALDVSGKPVSLTAYPHRQTKRGVVVEVNRGKRTLIKGAFLATMPSGHKGVWRREGTSRLPIKELLGSRPVDALLHKGEAEGVLERGQLSFGSTFERLLPMELEKAK
jgi:hypothetical protein